MNRRALLAAIAGVTIGGCVTANPGAETGSAVENESEANGDDENGDNASGDDANSDDADEEDDDADSEPETLDDDAVLEQFESALAERGFEGVSLEFDDDGLALGYDATGPTDDDVATEIELITDDYTTLLEDGGDVSWLEATAYDPDGAALDAFAIDTEWVEAYLEGALEWNELLAEVGATFENFEAGETNTPEAETDDEDGSDDDIDDGDERSDDSDETGDN